MDKAYDPQQFEKDIYTRWEKSGFFDPAKLPGERPEMFSICMPPPNVTGVLHLGHALENALMDVKVRYERMNGKRALLVPGTDHAAVATQARVEKNLIDSGKYKDPRKELGREGLLSEIRSFAEESKQTILNQIKRMGTSCDWDRLAYTFDDARSRIVNDVFIRMFDDGLIYRGSKIVNWDYKLQTTVSDDELEWEDETTKFYYFKYGPFTIGTARPETKFGDKYVVMHPDDDRYKEFDHGQEIEVEWITGTITATIIKDEAADPEFGTGVMTITPWHDATDFEIAERHNLDKQQIIGFDGKLLDIAGDLAGTNIIDARKKIVDLLDSKGLLEKTDENYEHRVARSDRGKVIIEPQIKTQWFVDVNKEIPGKGKTLKNLMKEAVETGHNGDKEQKVDIVPKRFEKNYYGWIDNLRDWNISRQIWWGHRIPVWYKGDEQKAQADSPGEGWVQDEDTLDTWFSSGMWTFSTLQGDDFEQYHPTSWMQMGYEILFFWMARMILMSTYTHDQIPFKTAYIHGMLRDKDNQKFSKSLGNGIDPIEVGEKHGTDALRISLLAGMSPGNDGRFYEEKVEQYRNLVNKLWNISRFIKTIIGESKVADPELKSATDHWIAGRFESTITSVRKDIEADRYSQAIDSLYSLTWHDFADWYVEIAKVEGDKDALLVYFLKTLLALWHPFAPFVTEAIWSEFGFDADSLLMVADYPSKSVQSDSSLSAQFDTARDTIVALRAFRTDYRIDIGKLFNISLNSNSLKKFEPIIQKLARVDTIDYSLDPDYVQIVVGSESIGVGAKDVIDMQKEIKRLDEEVAQTKKYISSSEGELNNSNFVDNAPAQVVAQKKQALSEAEEKLSKLESLRSQLS